MPKKSVKLVLILVMLAFSASFVSAQVCSVGDTKAFAKSFADDIFSGRDPSSFTAQEVNQLLDLVNTRLVSQGYPDRGILFNDISREVRQRTGTALPPVSERTPFLNYLATAEDIIRYDFPQTPNARKALPIIEKARKIDEIPQWIKSNRGKIAAGTLLLLLAGEEDIGIPEPPEV